MPGKRGGHRTRHDLPALRAVFQPGKLKSRGGNVLGRLIFSKTCGPGFDLGSDILSGFEQTPVLCFQLYIVALDILRHGGRTVGAASERNHLHNRRVEAGSQFARGFAAAGSAGRSCAIPALALRRSAARTASART